MLKLVAEILREPAFPDTEFEQVRQSQLTGIESSRSEPQFQAMNELRRHSDPLSERGCARRAHAR